ncbi:hypothetical protein DPMN_123984 [Dreissena polymorpha]|uniref:Uncharacterized protein n=1 Tax=Dreissena polymorpha TaxID=45954 RepID=A0A9D4GVB6_DREPO|nr:hypothetical protein DPMN_123984 [Dreissena polymorpha]
MKSLLEIHQPSMVPLLECFKQIGAPEIIIYDNACNLHQYALNRDPVFISHTRMVVDGLHWDNHTGKPCFSSKICLYSAL